MTTKSHNQLTVLRQLCFVFVLPPETGRPQFVPRLSVEGILLQAVVLGPVQILHSHIFSDGCLQ